MILFYKFNFGDAKKYKTEKYDNTDKIIAINHTGMIVFLDLPRPNCLNDPSLLNKKLGFINKMNPNSIT